MLIRLSQDPSKVSSMEVADVLKVTQPTAVVDADGGGLLPRSRQRPVDTLSNSGDPEDLQQ
jgi:hypothetical protein